MGVQKRAQYRNHLVCIVQESEVGQVYAIYGAVIFRTVKALGGDVIQIVGVLGFQSLVITTEGGIFLG